MSSPVFLFDFLAKKIILRALFNQLFLEANLSSNWDIQKSSSLYGVNEWGGGYFKINDKGNLAVCPETSKKNPNAPSVDLKELTEELMERGIRLPILLRFPDIVKSRIQLLNNCFKNAFQENNYKGRYCGVYPIKVNQNHQLVRHIVDYGEQFSLGLEAGSKPELLVVLALSKADQSMIICNGFKDEEFVETALLSLKIGRNTVIVVDRMSELPLILKVADRLNIKPRIGLRAKLYSKGAGKWVESSGARSKFGLTPAELCECIEILKARNAIECLELVHFHIGSQIKSIQAIKSSLKEGARYYAEMRKMGATNLNYIDVGGGLAVDYDGTTSSDSSSNYSEQEYANDVVYAIAQVCERHDLPNPNIITESGRALVAHHSVLIYNVLGTNQVTRETPQVEITGNDSPLIHNLAEIYKNISPTNLSESYHDIQEITGDALKLYTLGYMSLQERAKSENLIAASFTKIYQLARQNPDFEDLANTLRNELSDTYFCNFSIFQSAPDSWAVKHTFPVLPIHKLSEEPTRRAIVADLTCDSDGKIDQFVENYQYVPSLAVHPYKEGESYYMGIFLLGAYQEALGDLHNLFGDTDAVDVLIDENTYTVESVVEGDKVSEILSYIQYDKRDLVNRIRIATENSIRKGTMTNLEAKLLLRYYEDGLDGYTYLE